ncbi:MAG TPA: glycosyltransferase, partial [Candidatus Eisenbacteria bacterium]
MPPPWGGMANQMALLTRLWRSEGVVVEPVFVNAAIRPVWASRIHGIRALFRLVPYVGSLWRVAGRVDVMHVMASSGWSWHLFAAPAVWTAALRGVPCVVNYRGGQADEFLTRQYVWVRPTLGLVSELAVPSSFLAAVFGRRRILARIVPNVVDRERFFPRAEALAPRRTPKGDPRILVPRNLEPVYDVATALEAFRITRDRIPAARLVVAGAGPEEARLRALADRLGIADATTFAGALENERMAALYRESDLVLNPSLADNMPISLLEAMASGVPVVSTSVGGVPFLVEDGRTALLVPPGDSRRMAAAMVSVLDDPGRARRLVESGLSEVARYAWPAVRDGWQAIYASVSRRAGARGPKRTAPLRPYTAFVSRIAFPLHERLKGHDSPARLHRLEESQWWPAERLQEARLARLRAFLVGIGARVPYYRRLFAESGFRPEALQSIEDLRRLPLTSKETIRASFDDLRAEGAGPCSRVSTGGSTGEPLTFLVGPERVSHDVAAKWRATRWWGLDVGDREIAIWGSPIEVGRQDRVRELRDGVLRTRLLSAFRMSDDDLDRFLSIVRRTRPAMLFGYASAVALLARHARRRGVPCDRIGVRAAFVTAEQLFPDQRRDVEDVFGCRVANGYGGRDSGFVAHECPAGGMHLSAEDIVVEVVDAEGRPLPPGETGELVVTHMASSDFPFVRYRTGDIATLDPRPCACGRTLPKLRDIQGRATDFLTASDGGRVHALALIYVLRETP